MTCCDHCTDAEGFFTTRAARRELRRYRRRGPTGTTARLLEMLRKQDFGDGRLLDIGGGIGALQHELIPDRIAHATHVDAARAYLDASRDEATRRGHAHRIDQRFGDFVDLASDLSDADVVTLDRVVCCYPDMQRLVAASAAKARHLYALSFPRDHLGTRAGLRLANAWFGIKRSSFRTYLHPPDAIAAAIEGHGLRRVAQVRMLVWQVELYRRP